MLFIMRNVFFVYPENLLGAFLMQEQTFRAPTNRLTYKKMKITITVPILGIAQNRQKQKIWYSPKIFQ